MNQELKKALIIGAAPALGALYFGAIAVNRIIEATGGKCLILPAAVLASIAVGLLTGHISRKQGNVK
ncbi:MAG: hypothetical protein AAB437_02880 [Patescibacteria group bacterium]